MDFSKWLKGKFLNWQVEQGESRTQAQFAAYLGVPATSFSNWVNTGSKPRSEYIGVLAAKLGPEIYDVLGMTRPAGDDELAGLSPIKQALIKLARHLPDEDLEKILPLLEERDQFHKQHPVSKPAR